MKMKTTEEKREAVLAEVNRIGLKIDSAPILIGDGLEICMGYIQEGIGNNIQHEAVYLFFAGKTVAVFWSQCSDDQIGLFHRLLGLEARDAVQSERAKSAALVEALEKIYACETDPAIEYIAKSALQAHKKGGVQG